MRGIEFSLCIQFIRSNSPESKPPRATKMQKQPDLESGQYGTPENFFNEKQIRRQFINKVYSILSAQVLYTVLVVAVFMNV